MRAEARPKGPTLDRFDCSSTLDEKRDLSLRGENAGPLGATWNWHTGGLRCQARVPDVCAGKLRARLHVGDRRYVDVERETAPPDATFTLAVPSSMWNDALRAQPGLPYETLSLTLEVLLLCEDAPVHLVDAFVGRFGAGE